MALMQSLFLSVLRSIFARSVPAVLLTCMELASRPSVPSRPIHLFGRPLHGLMVRLSSCSQHLFPGPRQLGRLDTAMESALVNGCCLARIPWSESSNLPLDELLALLTVLHTLRVHRFGGGGGGDISADGCAVEQCRALTT